MRRSILLFSALLFIVACNTNNKFRITGELSDKSYDGEWIYLVPLVNAPVERVDSTTIKDGAFSFSGTVKENEIYVIRTRPQLRLKLEELLIVKEPGNIHVQIGAMSNATGTALNDTLQSWKQKKIYFTTQARILRGEYESASDFEKKEIQVQIDSLVEKRDNYYVHFIENNKENVVGEMVARLTKRLLTPEQIKTLGLEK